jgi:hypothetical protein
MPLMFDGMALAAAGVLFVNELSGNQINERHN